MKVSKLCWNEFVVVLLQLVMSSHVFALQRREEWGRVLLDGEYCDHESFQGQCFQGEIVQILKAQYGHIKLGKCIKDDLGYLGCKADVTSILSRRCDGKARCQISVVDRTLKDTAPCRSSLSKYLQVSYACFKTFPTQLLCSTLSAKPETQYLPSLQLFEGACSKNQPLHIAVQPGQQINLTLISLEEDQQSKEFGVVVDKNGKQWPLATEGRQTQHIAVSDSNDLSIALEGNTKFILAFQAIGCPDITAPRGTQVRRNGQEAIVSCPDTDQTWTLQCRGYHWLGVIGNCTQPVFPIVKPEGIHDQQITPRNNLKLSKDVIYLIMGCATIFLSVLVITTGYVCLKRAQIYNSITTKPEPEWLGTAQMTLLNKPRPNSDYMTPQYVPEAVSQPQPAIYDTPLPDPPVVSTTTRNTVKRNNEEDYTASLSSNSTDYTRKYFVLDKDYVNTKNLINI